MALEWHLLDLGDVVAEVLIVDHEHEACEALSFGEALAAQIGLECLPPL